MIVAELPVDRPMGQDRRTIREARAAWTRWQRVKNDLIFRLARFAMWIVGRLPTRLAVSLGGAVGLLGWLVARGDRRQTLENLAIAFPERSARERRRLGRRCFASLGRRAAEICRLGRLDLTRTVTMSEDDRRVVDEAIGRGRGLLWITAHLGNWELLAVGLGVLGYDVRPVATPSYDPRFTDVIHRWRLDHGGVRTIWRGIDDVGAEVAAALREGAIVGLLIDQDTKIRGHFVPFFGKMAWTPSGAAELARASGAPAVAGFIRRRADRRGHEIRVVELDLVTGDDAPSVDRRNTATFTAAIEDAVRQAPEDWVWMHRRWRTRPPEEAGELTTRTPTGLKAEQDRAIASSARSAERGVAAPHERGATRQLDAGARYGEGRRTDRRSGSG